MEAPSWSDGQDSAIHLQAETSLFSWPVAALHGGAGGDGDGGSKGSSLTETVAEADAVSTAAVAPPAGTPACLRRTPLPAGHQHVVAAVD